MDKPITAKKIQNKELMLPVLFCGLEYIDIEMEPEDEIEILDGLILTNTKKYFQKNFDQSFRTIVGTREVDRIERCSSYCCGRTEKEKKFDPQEELVAFSLKVSTIKTLLWLLKDNSVHCNTSFIHYRQAEAMLTETFQLSIRCSKCTGEISKTTYSKKDMTDMRAICNKMKFIPKHSKIDQAAFKEKTRLHLFLYHLDHARTSRDLSFKIMNYCTAFQTLFETSTFDTSHQPAKRIALFMSGEQEERLMMYHAIKEAFRVHFLVSHGEKIKPGLQERLTEISQYCDTTARNLFIKISASGQLSKTFKSGTKSIDNYFTKLMFTS